MLPVNFWADTAGGLLGMLFQAMLGLFLAPLTALTDSMIAFLTQLLPQ